MIKHVSFDLWLTLIKSNPDFKRLRAEYFHSNYNPYRLSLKKVTQLIKEVDIMCNISCEISGINICAESMYGMVLHKLGNVSTKEDLIEIYDHCHFLFISNLPSLYDEYTLTVLDDLKKRGITMSILSNTGFVKGSTVHYALKQIGISDYFSYEIYSDEVGYAKPHSAMFSQVHDNAKCNGNNILHVGDNVIADGRGAIEYGVKSFIINSNNNTIKSLLDENIFSS